MAHLLLVFHREDKKREKGKEKKLSSKIRVKVASCLDTVPSTGALTLLMRSSVIPRSRKPDEEAKKI